MVHLCMSFYRRCLLVLTNKACPKTTGTITDLRPHTLAYGSLHITGRLSHFVHLRGCTFFEHGPILLAAYRALSLGRPQKMQKALTFSGCFQCLRQLAHHIAFLFGSVSR
eukprot:TRINITY_DN19636_c0_g1_i1.p3 TRINITY_DN19636_c0_g1~~TRINITY_DN19636_c0_g1_i1.p3  ORF type:complete len:110 (+),score=13.92 TRINITY_DN19636_c0_g1_i1:499-828(+)